MQEQACEEDDDDKSILTTAVGGWYTHIEIELYEPALAQRGVGGLIMRTMMIIRRISTRPKSCISESDDLLFSCATYNRERLL